MAPEITINFNMCESGNKKNPEIKITGAEDTQFTGLTVNNFELPPLPGVEDSEGFGLNIPAPPMEASLPTESNAATDFPPLPQNGGDSTGELTFIGPPETIAEVTQDSGFIFTAPDIPQGNTKDLGNQNLLPPFPPDETMDNLENEGGDIPLPPEPR